jgi:hypothetical protein
MPATVRKVKGGYRVTTPEGTTARKTTKKKADRQARLLNALAHGWKPAKRKKGS